MYSEQAAINRDDTVSCCPRLYASQSPSSANEQRTEYAKGEQIAEENGNKLPTNR